MELTIIFCVCFFGYFGAVLLPAWIAHKTSVKLHRQIQEMEKPNEIPARTEDEVDRLSDLWYS